MPLDDSTRQQIESTISENNVVLFMKGNRGAPQCGFSSQVVQMLDTLIPSYATVDVLAEPAIRDGIKEFSSWPTVPQLYVEGEFLGGCDIVRELFDSGELQEKLGIELAEVTTPSITVDGEAVEALRDAIAKSGGSEGAELHLMVDAAYRCSLAMAPRAARDIEVESNGIVLYVDPVSATRAEGVVIDMADGPNGRGFRVENPNSPRAKELGVGELQRMIEARGDALELLDVRTPEERATASIAGSTLMTELEAKRLQTLPRDTPLVFYCHLGGRSQAAADHFASLGFSESYTVTGGIDAWSQEIDSSVARY